MSGPGGGEASAEGRQVPNQLAILVPTFDPVTDNVEIWTNKVELLMTAWPANKVQELATRLVLGCKGTAYQKLQLLRGEVLTNSEKGIQRLIGQNCGGYLGTGAFGEKV